MRTLIIWLNGAFGAGKTQTAFELRRRLGEAFVYDPENMGCCIRQNVPVACKRGDFQDYPMWRSFNYEMFDYIAANYTGIILVPMTITRRDYYDELVGRLAERHDVRHFILMAGRKTLLRRLRGRLEGPNSWAARQIGRCLAAFSGELCQTQVDTEALNVWQVAEHITALCGLSLPPDSRSRPRRALDRLVTQLRHIR